DEGLLPALSRRTVEVPGATGRAGGDDRTRRSCGRPQRLGRLHPAGSLAMRRALLAGLSLGALFAAGAARAQTVITPDVLAGRGLGTTATRSGTVTTIDGGALVGANLFHSFADFSLAAGDTARWARAAGDGASIRNVVSRVTGGRPSEIDGTLDSTA